VSKRRKTNKSNVALAPARVWLFRILAIVSPVALLFLVEFILRLAGFGYQTDFFRRVEMKGTAYWTGNPDFGRRFFPKSFARAPATFAFPIMKEPGIKRIFVLGESAALGDPQPAFGFSRMLERLLEERFPSNRFEVINVAVTAINSHVILPIARECASKGGDLWIVYMGNNEVVGPFGAGTVFGAQVPPLPMVRANLWFKTTRIGQLCDDLAQRWRGSDEQYWKGMELMAQQRVPRSDPRMTNLYSNFRKNLSDILVSAKGANVPVILSTVAVNQKDCPPFASIGGSAELEFKAGWKALTQNRTNEAKQHFQRAVDEDALRFRADSAINNIIRQSGNSARLIDADRYFGLAGDEEFFEHVHFTSTGNYRLARLVAEETASILGLKGRANWITQQECEKLIGFTDWNRSHALRMIIDRMKLPPFVGTLQQSNRVAGLQAEDDSLRARFDPANYKRQAESVLKAAAKYPQDWQLRYNAGVLLSLTGDYARATEELQAAIRLLPLAPDPYYSLAGMLAFQKKNEEAIALYKDALRFGQNFDVLVRLGFVELDQRKYDDAIGHLRAAIRVKPDSVGARLKLGAAFLQTNKPMKAREQFRQILKIEPENAGARELLKRAGG
jgi:tetratricopeptide (TPR) repeat protein